VSKSSARKATRALETTGRAAKTTTRNELTIAGLALLAASIVAYLLV